MKVTRRIIVEKHSVTLIKTSGIKLPRYCRHCGETILARDPEHIEALLKNHAEEIGRTAEKKQIGSAE